MTSRIVIENGLVQVQDIQTTDSIPLAAWLPKIERRAPVTIPVLPTNTRAVHWDETDPTNRKLNVLIEIPPHVPLINFNGHRMKLAFPFTRFVFTLATREPDRDAAWQVNSYYAFFALAPLRNPAKQDMIAALLPNVSDDGHICFGTTAADANQHISARLDQLVNEFFVSKFNGHLTVRLPNGATSYDPWIEATKKDPNHWVTWPDLRPGGPWQLRAANDFLHANGNDPIPQIVAPDGIPPIETTATFGAVAEWLDGLTVLQRERLRTAIARIPTPDEITIARARAATTTGAQPGILADAEYENNEDEDDEDEDEEDENA